MSISSINNSAQTGLVPNTLLGYSTNGVSAIEILPTSIVLGGNLTTTPVYVSIDATNGLSSTNANGIQVSSDIDMNQNDITDVLNITNTQNDLNLYATGPHNLKLNAGGYFSVQTTGATSAILLESSFYIGLQTPININCVCPGGFFVSTNPFNPMQGDGIIYGSAKRVSITDDTATIGTFYPTFVNASGDGKDLSIDTALNFNGSTNTLTCPNFSGTSSNASQVALTVDNTSGTYFIPFSKTANANNNSLFVDNSVGPLTYNPAGSQLTCQTVVAQIALPTATDTFTFSGTTLSAAFPGTSIRGFKTQITGTTNTISILAFSGGLVNSQYTITIRNDGTGNLTINNSFTPSSTYLTCNYPILTIPTGGTAIMYIRRVNIPVNGDVYVINVEPLGLGAVLNTLSQTLINGNSAGTNDINMNFNDITNVDTITLTDGTNTNTVNGLGYTTRNSVQNLTHFLNFSDSSATGTGAIQKTGGISCNPSTNTITATTFTGNASNAIQVALTSDNTNGTYFIPFSKTANANNNTLFIDNATGPLTYNPANNLLACNVINANILIPTSTPNLTFSGTTLSGSFGLASSMNGFRVDITGGINTLDTLGFTNGVVNGVYTIQISNSGTGDLTIAGTFSPSSTYLTTDNTTLTIATGGKALLVFRYVNFAVGGNIYIIDTKKLF